MTEGWFRYVLHAHIPKWEAVGWINTGRLRGTHHGYHADLLRWPFETDPVEP